jgi:hypothetical protein
MEMGMPTIAKPKTDKRKAGQGKTGQGKAGQSETGQTRPGQAKGQQARAGKPRPDRADVRDAAGKLTARAKAAASPVLGDRDDTFQVIERAMRSAGIKAVAENDHLGIATPGSDAAGRIVFRKPKKRAGRTPDAG